MRKILFPILIAGVALLCVGVAIGWFAARRAMPDSAQEASAGGVGRGPALAQIAEAEKALEMAGFERAFVHRWQGGLLDGYVLLDTPQGPKRMSLNTEKMAQDAYKSLASEAGERDGK